MAELTENDKSAVAKLEAIVKGSPVEKRFDWAHAEKQDDGSIRLPGIPANIRGDALLLSLPELRKRSGVMQPGADVNALALLQTNQLLLPIPDEAYFKIRSEVDSVAANAPPAAREAYIYRPLKGASDEFLKARFSAMVNHETCHIDNRGPFLTTATNSEVACSSVGNDLLANAGFVEQRNKKWIVNNLAPSLAPLIWAREVVILTNGKFDETTRDILPGDEKFNDSMRARIARFKYEGPLRGLSEETTNQNIAIRQAVIDSPKKNGHVDALVAVMSEQLGREYSDLRSKNAEVVGDDNQTQKKYIDDRIADFKKYLAGEAKSFQISAYHPSPR